MQENKYYTPNISELYVGYECESNWDFYRNEDGSKSSQVGGWKGVIFKGINQAVIHYLSLGMYRTKYLDSDDIISLGFEPLHKTDVFFGRNSYFLEVPKDINIMFMDDYTVTFELKHEQGKIRIEKQMFGGFSGNEKLSEQVYYGPCKSKNELKKILEWIK